VPKENKGTKGPVIKLRDGNLTVDVWENIRDVTVPGSKKTVKRAMYSGVLKRHYTDENGDWQENDNIPYQDLPRAASLLTEAYRQVVEVRADKGEMKDTKDEESVEE